MMTTTLSPEITNVALLAERCDSCGAAAKVEVVLAAGGGLAFCGHHANRHAAMINPIAARIRVEDGFGWAGTIPAA